MTKRLGDGECDHECNYAECNWDNGDCPEGVAPAPHNIPVNCAEGCWHHWLRDGVCDDVCNTEACEFDGGDCAHKNAGGGCPRQYRKDGFCDMPDCIYHWFDYDGNDCRGACAPGCGFGEAFNGYCDYECYNFNCKYDHGECDQELAEAAVRCSNWCDDVMIGDGNCDRSCHVAACNWDNGDCDNTCMEGDFSSPYYANNGKCDMIFNSPACGWDTGECGDCSAVPGCTESMLGDGKCDEACNVAAC